MKRRIILVWFSILLGCLNVSGAGDDPLDPGRANPFDFPLLKVPIGSTPTSGAVKEKKGEGVARNDKKTEKDILDKKVDDAIKKAWEEK